MRVAVPKEVKNHEYRVGMTPMGVADLVQHGHEVRVQQGAGVGAGFSDEAYLSAGARLYAEAETLFHWADLIVKVKEPQVDECGWLSEGQVLFTYLHLAASQPITELLLATGVTAIAYETVTAGRSLPLLTPMSQVAGRLAVQAGATCLERSRAGAGVLLGGVPGVPPALVMVLGGGVVGEQAARIALGMGADVVLFDTNPERLAQLDLNYGPRLKTCYSTPELIAHYLPQAALVIGAVLIPGAAAPKLVRREQLAIMQDGAVLVDVAIDQGGCFETSRPTTHEQPTYLVDHVVHYCVTNMPGAVPRTSTMALTQATRSYVLQLANTGWRDLMRQQPGFAAGLNVHKGKVYCLPVAQSLGLPFVELRELLG